MPRPDHQSASRRASWRVALHPATWGAYLPAAAAAAFVTAPWWVPVGLGVGATAALAGWWHRRWPVLRDRTRFAQVSRWVAEEDAAFEGSISAAALNLERPLLARLSGQDSAAQGIKLLQTTLARKRALEACFLADGLLTAEEEEVMDMIEGLSSAFRDELVQLGRLDRDRTQDDASIATIRRAAHAIGQTAEAMDELAATLTPKPVETQPPDNRTVMRHYIERLDERVAQARAVKQRLEGVLANPFEEPPRQFAAE